MRSIVLSKLFRGILLTLARPLHVIGRDDVEIKCIWDEEVVVGGALTCTQALKEDILQGGAVELAPG